MLKLFVRSFALMLISTVILAAGFAQPQPSVTGDWKGTLSANGTELHLVFHITADKAGALHASLDSVDQNANGIPVSSVTRNGTKLSMTVKIVHGTYEGTVSADGTAITGTWSQGMPLPLTLQRGKDHQPEPKSDLAPRRPQMPIQPYPYREEDVRFPNPSGGNTLAGTLTIPQGKGPFPAVVLICGSGPHDRDESLLGHKPFLVLSDYLTRKGILVLRYDKRGVGQSTGNYAQATSADFANDAEAAFRYLATRPESDPHRTGLLGHSEGGTIAPMVAARNQNVAFLVLMAGTGVPGDQILVEQNRRIELASGIPAEQVEQDAERQKEIIMLIKQQPDNAIVENQAREKITAQFPDGQLSSVQLGSQVKALTTPWFRYFFTYDPATSLRKVQCPVLALNGSLDLQVPPSQNLPAIRKALADGGNSHVEADELEGLNHLFQHAKTGLPAEYGQIEETIAPEVLDKIASWILKQS